MKHDRTLESMNGRSIDRQQRNLTVSELIVEVMRAESAKALACVPGSAMQPLLNALYRSNLTCQKIVPLLVKHESAVCFTLQGMGYWTKSVGFGAVISGPGLTNAATGIVSCMNNQIPLVLIVCSPSTLTDGRGVLQEFDAVPFLKTLVKQVVPVSSAAASHDLLFKAIRIAKSPPCGVVAVVVPRDVLQETGPGKPVSTSAAAQEAAITCHPDEAKRVAEVLSRDSRSILLLGAGVRYCDSQTIISFIEQWKLPTIVTQRGRGVIDEDHDLYIGHMGSGFPASTQALLDSGEVATILAVGTSFSQVSTHNWTDQLMPSQSLIHVDHHIAAIGANYRATLGICADASEFFVAMSRLRSSSDVSLATTLEERRQWGRAWRNRYVNAAGSSRNQLAENGFTASRVLYEMDQRLPEKSIILTGSGIHMILAMKMFRFQSQSKYFYDKFANMGTDISTAIGAAMRHPDYKVVNVTGDGCFLLAGLELSTCVEYGLPVVYVVINNRSLGLTKGSQRFLYNRQYIASGYSQRTRFAEIARSLGALGFECLNEDDFIRAFEEAVDSSQPALIDVVIGSEHSNDEMEAVRERLSGLRIGDGD